MPPKPKFTRDKMITAAMNLIEERGYESLTARELGKYLGSSSCPIFTLFKDMDELKTEVKNRAVEIFNEYMAVAEEFYPAYKKRGMQWVKFASEQPRLFRLLFMQETSGQADFDAAQKIIPFGKQNDIDIIMRDYNASREQAERLFRQMWIYSYGLCSLVASKVCVFSEKEIARNLGEIFNGMIYPITPNLLRLCPPTRIRTKAIISRRTAPTYRNKTMQKAAATENFLFRCGGSVLQKLFAYSPRIR